MGDPYNFVNQDSAPKPVVAVITTLLRSWDMAKSDYKFLSTFKPDAILHVLAEPVRGHEAIKALHDSMVEPDKGPVLGIQHHQDRLFTMPGGNDTKIEVVYTGKMENFLVDKQTIVTEYATWLILSESEEKAGELQIEYLRVLSDTSHLKEAIARILENGRP